MILFYKILVVRQVVIKIKVSAERRVFMKKHVKAATALAVGSIVLSGTVLGVVKTPLGLPEYTVLAAEDSNKVEVSDLVIKFLGVPEYEPNRYTKSNGGKWAPEELEKGLEIKADMKLGEGNPEGMMAPLKHSLADIMATLDANQATGDIVITYNGLKLTMKAGSTKATLDNGKTTETLTIREELVPYFMAVEGEKTDTGEQYYACYLPVKFTAEALGGDVIWNDAMHRMEMAFAFYYADAAITPVVNSKSAYTTKGMEKDSYNYTELSKRITESDSINSEKVKSNVADMIKAAVTVVDPVYQNTDGGWGKTNTDYDLLNDTFTRLCNKAYSTIDNGSTHGQIKFLGRVIRLSKENPALFASYENELKDIESGFWKGVKYFMDAQTDLGGWPQYYPYSIGYFKNITYNDNAMPNVMALVYALTNDSALIDNTMCEDLAWAREELKNNAASPAAAGVTTQKLQTAWDKALDFTLDAQVEIDGTLTGWAQQYEPDAATPTPAGGRAYELPSVSSGESLSVVNVLTNIKNPSAEVRKAVESYVSWINSVGFTGYEMKNVSDRTRELGKDRILVYTGSNNKLFGRFYGLDTTGEYYGLDLTGKFTSSKFYEIFSGRDGVAKLTMNSAGMSERRSGYSFTQTKCDTKATSRLEDWKKALGE